VELFDGIRRGCAAGETIRGVAALLICLAACSIAHAADIRAAIEPQTGSGFQIA